jgi:phosphoribosylaminoimidazolecarboxamide formyltransferase/IMP cyclohydrolase
MTDAMLRPIERALISVYDKTGLLPLAQALAARGVEILSTGGTARALAEAGIAVTDVASETRFPEMLDGRVKTLHPALHGGILARRDKAAHRVALQAHGIRTIDLVVSNLYPFAATIARGASWDECIENIDIGGPSLIRGAAKNHDFVTVLTDPADYDAFLAELAAHDGATTLALRRRLAGAAYARTAAYDAMIASWMAGERGETFPAILTVGATRKQLLRYGENPHQAAALYVADAGKRGVATAEQVQGKELSYNNLNDTDAAFELVAEFDAPAVAIIKHANPCGVATGASLAEAYEKALACDPVSAFGGIVAVNRELDAASAAAMAKLFLEVIIAPDASEAARAALAGKAALRLLRGGCQSALARRRLSLADARQWQRRRRRSQTRQQACAERSRAGRFALRLPNLQARQVERHRLREIRRDGRHRRRADEPRRQRPHRKLEGRGGGQGGGSRRGPDKRQRRRLGRLLPLRRRAPRLRRGRRHRGHPTRRLETRRRGHRSRRRARHGDGVHRDAAFPALRVRTSI